MSLTRWDPFQEIVSMRDAMDRLFQQSFAIARPSGGAAGLAIDMYEQGDNIVVEADLPGMNPEDVDIQVQGNHLVINAQSQRNGEKKDQQYYRRERVMQRYTRVVPLPTAVNADQATARYDNGCLRIELPTAEEARPRRISVQGTQPMLEGTSQPAGQPAEQPAGEQGS